MLKQMYVNNYDKNKESSYVQYLDANNLYGWKMPQKLPVDWKFKWKKHTLKLNEDFISNYDEDSDKEYIFKVDVDYPKNVHHYHSDLQFLPERIKINKYNKLVCNLYDKNNYVIYIRSLKQALDHRLILKKFYKVIQFNQEVWLKEHIDMNTELRKQAKNDSEKDFVKLMNNSVFGKTMEIVRRHRDIKLVTTDNRRNYLVSEPNYHTTKYFSENVLVIRMKKKIRVTMNKPVYLGLSILKISKILMYEFWYDYIKPKYQENAKLCYMDANSFIINVKTEDVNEDIADDVEKRFGTSNYETALNRPLPTEKNKKVIGPMKDELGGKIMTEFLALRSKTYSYLMNDGNIDKKANGTKKCVIKRRLTFNDYKDC